MPRTWSAIAGLALLLLPAGRILAQEAAPALEASVAKTMRRNTVRSTVGPVETPLSLEISQFLLDHPDISATLVRNHRIAPYQITMISPRQSLVDDGDGTKGTVTLVEKKGNVWIYFGEGVHESRIFPSIHATAVVVMNIQAVQRTPCQQHVRTTFDVYVRLRNPVLATLVKALRPFLKDTVVRKFSKAFLVAHEVGRLIARDPSGIFAEIRASPTLSKQEQAAIQEFAAGWNPEPSGCL